MTPSTPSNPGNPFMHFFALLLLSLAILCNFSARLASQGWSKGTALMIGLIYLHAILLPSYSCKKKWGTSWMMPYFFYLAEHTICLLDCTATSHFKYNSRLTSTLEYGIIWVKCIWISHGFLVSQGVHWNLFDLTPYKGLWVVVYLINGHLSKDLALKWGYQY